MGSEMRGRLLEAMHYQRLAVEALIPQKAAGHLEVIEQELKAMLLESLQDGLTSKGESQKKEHEKQISKVKKVDIQ